jgi:hypothetical protein
MIPTPNAAKRRPTIFFPDTGSPFHHATRAFAAHSGASSRRGGNPKWRYPGPGASRRFQNDAEARPPHQKNTRLETSPLEILSNLSEAEPLSEDVSRGTKDTLGSRPFVIARAQAPSNRVRIASPSARNDEGQKNVTRLPTFALAENKFFMGGGNPQ